MGSDAAEGESASDPTEGPLPDGITRAGLKRQAQAAACRELGWVLAFAMLPYGLLVLLNLNSVPNAAGSLTKVLIANGAPYMSILTVAGLALSGVIAKADKAGLMHALLILGSIAAAVMYGIRFMYPVGDQPSQAADVATIVVLTSLVLPGVFYSGFLREVKR